MLNALKSGFASGFVRNVGILASGTVAGQAIMVLVLPLLTRLYDPGAFGLLGVYMSLLMVLSVAACLRLEISVPLPERDADAINLVFLGVIAATLIAALLGAAVALAPEIIVRWLGQPDMKAYLWLLPLGVWLAAVYSAIQFWSIRKGRYGQLARTQLVRAVGGAGAQTGFGLLHPTSFGLLFGHMLYTGLGTAGLLRLLWKHDRHLLPAVGFKALLANLRTQKRFPLFSVPEALLDTAANSIPVVLIAAIVGKQEAGFMLLAQRVTSIPVGLLGGSISRVYLAEASNKRKLGKLSEFTRQIMLTLLKIGLGPFLILGLVAPMLFPIIFGPDWVRAGTMVSWMMLYMLLQFIVAPVSTILHATGNQATAMALQLFGFILLIGTILVAASIVPTYVFESFAVASVVYYAAYLSVIVFVSRPEVTS